MPNPLRNRNRRDLRELRLERMFETRSLEWERAGLAVEVSEKTLRRAQRQLVVLVPLLVGVLVAWGLRNHLLGLHGHYTRRGAYVSPQTPVPVEIGTAVVVVALGWALATALGRAAAPTFMKRMDPGTAGTVGFLVRLATVAITLLYGLSIAGLTTQTLALGGAFTAVIFGLAAQQTLGNLIAGMVLISARPFKVGVRIRLQAGAVGGTVEGIVSSLGLLYTVLVRGDDRIMIPNSVVLAAVVVPLREPEPVDIRVRLSAGIRPSRTQEILDHAISTPTRNPARVLLEEIDGDELVVRIQATPERADAGAKLADEIIAALATVTDEHAVTKE
jgi:small conductance mechanosensitive channel